MRFCLLLMPVFLFALASNGADSREPKGTDNTASFNGKTFQFYANTCTPIELSLSPYSETKSTSSTFIDTKNGSKDSLYSIAVFFHGTVVSSHYLRSIVTASFGSLGLDFTITGNTITTNSFDRFRTIFRELIACTTEPNYEVVTRTREHSTEKAVPEIIILP